LSIDLLKKYEALDNIAPELDEEFLEQLGSDVCDNFEDDLSSRSDWEENYQDAMKLASQMVEEKSFPWDGASNMKYPILTEAAIQFNARSYPALVPNDSVVKSRVVGFDPTGQKSDAAIRVSRHMNYQLLEEMEEWEEDMDKLLLAVPIIGCMFKKSYYDPIKRRNVSVAVYPRNFVVDYYTTDLDSAYRKTHIVDSNSNEIAQMVAAGVYSDIDLGQAENNDQQTNDEITGLTKPSPSEATDHQLLEQHTYLDLDDDGIEEPYIITVDRETRQVIRIIVGFNVSEIIVNQNNDIVSIPQKQFFVKYGFVPSPDGSFYDMGFGQYLAPLNGAVDSLINQLIDAGTMANAAGGFIGGRSGLKSGSISLNPFEWKQLNVSGGDLKKSIFPLPVREPSQTLFNLLGMMINQAQRLSSTVDSMVGENPGQNQKAATTLAVLEQGSKVFSGIYKRLHRSFKKELKILFRLNSEYLTPESYFNVLDLNVGKGEIAQILKADYDVKSVNLVPTADTSVSSQQQKIAKAQAALDLVNTGYVNGQEATKRVLEAMEQPDIESLMKVPEQGPSKDQIEMQFKEKELALKEKQFQLDVVKVQQEDVGIQTKSILDLAKAEAAEEGSQLASYQFALKQLVEASKAEGGNSGVNQRAVAGVETQPGN